MSDDVMEPVVHVRPNGPYLVRGGVPVRRETIVTSEHGEPMTYRPSAPLETGEVSALCRCGHSENKPFCDGTHNRIGFDGTETAQPDYAAGATELGGSGITVEDNRGLCVHAGFCGTRATNVWKLVGGTDDTAKRIQVIAMIENCPSGALRYRIDGDDAPNEPALPMEIGVIDDGPLWVKGGIPVVGSDGTDHEVRARVTLCRCGASENKPYCDGSHGEAGFSDS